VWNLSDKCNKKVFSTKELTQRSKPGVVMISARKTTGIRNTKLHK
tara:strand:- start:21 stop:155 length:135 start_codon:yes stop_codon:yes gene_type:complete